MALVKVDDSTIVRDTKTRALINNENASRDEYYSKFKMLSTHKSEINKLNNDVIGLKSELSEIKELMKQLLTK